MRLLKHWPLLLAGSLALLWWRPSDAFVGQFSTIDAASLDCIGAPTNCALDLFFPPVFFGPAPSLAGKWKEVESPPGRSPLLVEIREDEADIQLRVIGGPDSSQDWFELEGKDGKFQNPELQLSLRRIGANTILILTPDGRELEFQRTKPSGADTGNFEPDDRSFGVGRSDAFLSGCTPFPSLLEPPTTPLIQKHLLRPARDPLPRSAPIFMEAAQGGSKHVSLAPLSRWIYYGGWLDDGQQLMLVDRRNSKALFYSLSGNLLAERHLPPQLSRSKLNASSGGELTLSVRNLFWRHTGGESGPQHTFGSSTSTLSEGLLGVTPAEASAYGTSIISIGDMLNEDSQWTFGLFWNRIGARPDPTILIPLKLDDPYRPLYFIGNPYVASGDEAGYFLKLETTPRLFKVTESGPDGPKAEDLRVEWGAEYSIPVLPPSLVVQDTKAFFQRLEAARMPVGIYVVGQQILVLEREPVVNMKGTKWTMVSVDATSGRVTGRILLPTQASHLVIVPGARRWAIVEKGPVESLGNQAVSTIVLLPSSIFRQPTVQERNMLAQQLASDQTPARGHENGLR